MFLEYAKDTDLSYVDTSYYKMYGLYKHQSNNTNIANLAMADAYGNSGVYLDSSNNTFMTNIAIAFSGTNGIYLLATEHTVIANSSVRMCTNAGIWLEGAVDTRICNTTTWQNSLDISLNSTENAYIAIVTVMSSDITRGLTLLNASNNIIEDVQVVKYKYSTNQTLKSRNVRVNEVIYLENCDIKTTFFNANKRNNNIQL